MPPSSVVCSIRPLVFAALAWVAVIPAGALRIVGGLSFTTAFILAFSCVQKVVVLSNVVGVGSVTVGGGRACEGNVLVNWAELTRVTINPKLLDCEGIPPLLAQH